MWALIGVDAPDVVVSLPDSGVREQQAIYALIGSLRPGGLGVDGLVPVPGCAPGSGGHGRYWLTATVAAVRKIRKSPFKRPSYLFLLTLGSIRLVGLLIDPESRVKVKAGARLSVECIFQVPTDPAGNADYVPDDWRADWYIRGSVERGELGNLVDLTPVVESDDDEGASAMEGSRQTPLLLDTDYGGGPLWYRDAKDRGRWGLDLGFFPLTESLHDRLVTWTAGDYHLHYDYEDDNPEHEAAWHDEGLALLGELRRELGPHYNIKFAHDLDA